MKLKKTEKKRQSHFEGIPRFAPALLAAFQIGQRVSHVGFDWPSPVEALKKVREEVQEVAEAMEATNRRRTEEEIGDAFFALANVARKLNINPETALRRANAKFIRRFTKLEKNLAARGKPLGEAGLPEMDAVWEELKTPKRRRDKPAALTAGQGPISRRR